MSYSSEVLVDTPLAYYRLGESSGTSMADSSGNARHGSYDATNPPVLGVAGLLLGDSDTAADFDGTADFASTPDAAWMSSITAIECLIEPDAVSGAVRPFVDRDVSGTSNARNFSFRITTAGKLDFFIFNAAGGVHQITGSTTLVANTKYHVAVRHDGTHLRLYLNGTEDATAVSFPTTIRTSSAAIRIGNTARTTGGATFFDGTVDEVAFYSTLSGARIAAHYLAATTVSIAVSAPVATATAQAHAPTISFERSFTVAAVTATATAEAHAPAISFLQSFTVDPPAATATAQAHAPTISFERSFTVAAVTATATATMLAPSLLVSDPQPVETDTDLIGTDPVDEEDWEAAWHVYPTVAPAALSGAWDVARNDEGATARKTRLRTVVFVDGVDVSTVNGIPTPTPDYTLLKPFSFGPGTMRVPGINPIVDDLSDYAWIRVFAKVIVARVNAAGTIQAIDYRGRIGDVQVNGPDLTFDLNGLFASVAEVAKRPAPVQKRRASGEYWVHAMLRKNRQPDDYDEGDLPVGVTLTTPGPGMYLDCANDTVSQCVKRDGTKLTVAYDETAHKWSFGVVDRETIHATVYFDSGEMRPSLVNDWTARPNQVFASGFNENGRKITFIVAPGMQQFSYEDIPAYPMAGDAPFGVGTDDSDTVDGWGVSQLIHRLLALGYLGRDDVGDGFDEEVEDAVANALVRARLIPRNVILSGAEVTPELWAWLWDADGGGYSMAESRREPAYEDVRLSRYLYTATGQLLGPNPDFDSSVHPISADVEFSNAMSRRQIEKAAATYAIEGDNHWTGDLSTQLAFIAGEHTPGDPITEADVLPARSIRPGMNLWAPLFQGGTLLHVSTCDVTDDGWQVRFSLDTRARDSADLARILERNEQNRISPAKKFWRSRKSTLENDIITGWIGEIGGNVTANQFLPGGQWTAIRFPLGDYGTISRLRTRVRAYDSDAETGEEGPDVADGGVEHAVVLLGVGSNGGFLDALIPAPLEAENDWWANGEIRDALEERNLLVAYGTEEDPCGYGYGSKTGGHDLTGNFYDDSGFAYRCPSDEATLLVWVAEDAVFLAGWIVRPALEEGT
jgi:hypothetical protein